MANPARAATPGGRFAPHGVVMLELAGYGASRHRRAMQGLSRARCSKITAHLSRNFATVMSCESCLDTGEEADRDHVMNSHSGRRVRTWRLMGLAGPRGAVRGELRALRGGSWSFAAARNVHASYRIGYQGRLSNVGFRCAGE